MGARLEITALDDFPEVREGDDLAALTCAALEAASLVPVEDDVLVFAQKIVSKSEGRALRLSTVQPSDKARDLAAKAEKDPHVVELILRESRAVLRCVPGVIIVEDRNGYVMANAGIDASNTEDEDTVLLLPVDPDASAARLRAALRERTGISLGVVINDSFGRAWRMGTCGTAIGVSGLPALIDLRGRPDRRGRAMQTSDLGYADELAAAASLMMGQGNEGRPVTHVRGAPHGVGEGRAADLVRPKAKDLFR